MCVRLAEIMSNVYFLLGQPPKEWLEVPELWYAVKMVSAKYIESIQQSDQNQIISSEEINFENEQEYDLSAVVGRGVPAWIERKSGDTSWKMVPIVNLHNLENEKNQGRQSCSFYGNVYGSFIAKLSYKSTEIHRLWYDPEQAFDLKQDSESVLPRNFNRMLELEVGVFTLPTLMNNAVRTMPKGEPIPDQQIMAWNNLSNVWRDQLGEWMAKWKTWLHRSRGAQSSGMRPRKFIRNLYG